MINDDDCDSGDDDCDSAVGEYLNAISTRISDAIQRKDSIEELLKGMTPDTFTTEEFDIVRGRIEQYNALISKLKEDLGHKTQLYQQRMHDMKLVIDRRKKHLAKFDDVLTHEPELAQCFVLQQNNMENQLRQTVELIHEDVL
jgi:hypothetical protein